MKEDKKTNRDRTWGEFRFSVVGGLFSSPPDYGSLQKRLKELAERKWRHPINGEFVKFSFGTIEHWYYSLKRTPNDPVSALSNQGKKSFGHGRFLSEKFWDVLKNQYQLYPDWTGKLHYDNLVALSKKESDLGELPSYNTLLRLMKTNAMLRKNKIRRKSPGLILSEQRLEKKEIRSFEMEHTGALWHLDFHHGSRKIKTKRGEWIKPLCLAIHDDHSRLACHVQWYLSETTEMLIHGLCQAILKRGRPWTIMTDNGSAMTACEFTQGVSRMGSNHTTTLPYSAYQNGKTERFWGILEGRLMAMLKGMDEISLDFLNNATQAWVEQEYNRSVNEETKATPLDRFLNSQDVSRKPPSWQELKHMFRMDETRNQRQKDGTVSIEGKRFEIPSQYRHMKHLIVRYARFDLSLVHLVDKKGKELCRIHPLDKLGNANGQRKSIHPETLSEIIVETGNQIPPLLEKLMADFSETGIPSPYLPKEETKHES